MLRFSSAPPEGPLVPPSPALRLLSGNKILIPYVTEDGGRTGPQAKAWLGQLATGAVASGHVRPPTSWALSATRSACEK